MSFKLPDIVLKNTNENIEKYLDRIYSFFKKDFIDSKPRFYKRIALKRHPLKNGKEATFWHFTTSGNMEDIREPDIERCERIKWPKVIIENWNCDKIKCWKNIRRNEERILFFFEESSYLVVLAERKDYVLPWTAYTVAYKNRKEKLLREYNDYKKKAGGAKLKLNDTVSPSTHGR